MESSSLFHFHTLSTLLLYFDSITPFNSILAPFRPSDRSISHPDRLQTTSLSRNRPANWKANTAVASVGIIAATYAIWQYSADREVSPVQHRGQDSQGLVDERQEDEQDRAAGEFIERYLFPPVADRLTCSPPCLFCSGDTSPLPGRSLRCCGLDNSRKVKWVSGNLERR